MEKAKIFFKEWVIQIGLEILVILLLLKYVFFLTVVPTGSMLPTIELKSWLFATRVHNPANTIKRGDIVVFDSDELEITLIKRCIGLPGDEIDIDEQGKLYINGELYPEEYVENPLGGAQSFDVPEDHYFFLGDNRAGSIDARVWDDPYIPKDKIIGEAHFTLWPLKNFGILK